MIIGVVNLPTNAMAALLPQSLGPYLALMLFGFVFAIAGHITRVRWLVLSGVILIFLGALVFPIALNLSVDNPPVRLERSGAQ